MEEWERIYSQIVNLNSRTDAIGWAWLISSFGGDKIKSDKLLPIVLDTDSAINEGYNRPSEETLIVMSRLLQAGKVPNKAMLSLVSSGILTML